MPDERMDAMAAESAAQNSEAMPENGWDAGQEFNTESSGLAGDDAPWERDGEAEDSGEAFAPGQPYALAPPTGIEAEDPLFGHFQEFVHERGWSQDRAKEGMEVYMQIEAQKDHLRQQEMLRAEDELRSEYGAGYEGNLARAQRAVQRLTRPEFSRFLAESGLGNHPEMVRHFVMLDELAGEDTFIPSDMGGAAGPARGLDGSPLFKDLARRG